MQIISLSARLTQNVGPSRVDFDTRFKPFFGKTNISQAIHAWSELRLHPIRSFSKVIRLRFL
jgi:hypothetical protein